MTLQSHLDRAQASVIENKASTEALHTQWRTHLVRMSYMLVIVSLHQSQQPTQACLKDIKAVNQALLPGDQISGLQAIGLVLHDGIVSIFSLVMATALTYFTSMSEPAGNFQSPAYVLATACLPPMLQLHFNTPMGISCVDDALLEQTGVIAAEKLKGFPVVLVFFGVLSVCSWFMDMQMNQHKSSVNMVLKLRKEMQEKEAAAKESTGTKKTK